MSCDSPLLFSRFLKTFSGVIHVDGLAVIELAGFPSCIGELLLKGDTREDFQKVLSRIAPTGFDVEIERWIHDGRSCATDLFCFGRLDHSHPTSNAAN